MKSRFRRLFPVFLGCVLISFSGLHAVQAKPLKVFILSGQSNMQGHAQLRTFEHIGMDPKTAPLLAEMLSEDGTPRVCRNVWISYLSTNLEKHGPLTVGYGADDNKIGPEFTFGITMQKLLDEPILIIKTAWGGKSLHTDFRPPGAGPYQFSDAQLANFAKRGQNVGQRKAEKIEATGRYYRLMVEHIKKVTSDISKVVPGYDNRDGFELAGFVWFQGWNDMVDSGTYPERDKPGGYDDYTDVFTHFIHDVRKDLSAPDLPFVIGVLGVGGPVEDYGPTQQRYKPIHQNFRSAMAAPAELPEFKGSVVAVLTEDFWDPQLGDLTGRDEKLKQVSKKQQRAKGLDRKAASALLAELRSGEFSEAELAVLEKAISNQAYHYLGSGKIMALTGRGFAEAMAPLVSSSGVSERAANSTPR